MANIKVLNMQGQDLDSVKVKDSVFKQEYNEALIHQVVVAYLANQRQGTKSTLSRSEVRGHAKKPWRQKGTGRARHGSTKAPQWRGGGVVFAPKPRDYSKKVNKEAKRSAFRSAISTKLANKEMLVLDNLTLKEGKTKEIKAVLDTFKLTRNTLFVTTGDNGLVLRATANLPKVDVTTAKQLNVYDILVSDKLVLTVDALKAIEEAYVD